MQHRRIEPEPNHYSKNHNFMVNGQLVFRRVGDYLIAANQGNYTPNYVQNIKSGKVFFSEDHDVETIEQLLEIARENS